MEVSSPVHWPVKSVSRLIVPINETKLALVVPIYADSKAMRMLPQIDIPRSALTWREHNTIVRAGDEVHTEPVTGIALLPNFFFHVRLCILDTTYDSVVEGEDDMVERARIMRDFLGRVASSLDYWYRNKFLLSEKIHNGGYDDARFASNQLIGSIHASDATRTIKAIMRLREHSAPMSKYIPENDFVHVSHLPDFQCLAASGLMIDVECRNHVVALAVATHFAMPEFIQGKFKGARFSLSKDSVSMVVALTQETNRWGKLDWKVLEMKSVENHVLSNLTQQGKGSSVIQTMIHLDPLATTFDGFTMRPLIKKWSSATALALVDYHTDYTLYMPTDLSHNAVSLMRENVIIEGHSVWYGGVINRNECKLVTSISKNMTMVNPIKKKKVETPIVSSSNVLKRAFEVSRFTESQQREKRLKTDQNKIPYQNFLGILRQVTSYRDLEQKIKLVSDAKRDHAKEFRDHLEIWIYAGLPYMDEFKVSPSFIDGLVDARFPPGSTTHAKYYATRILPIV